MDTAAWCGVWRPTQRHSSVHLVMVPFVSGNTQYLDIFVKNEGTRFEKAKCKLKV